MQQPNLKQIKKQLLIAQKLRTLKEQGLNMENFLEKKDKRMKCL